MLVLLTTRAILRDISDVLMERVPRAHDSAAMEAALLRVRPASSGPAAPGRRAACSTCAGAGARRRCAP